MGIPRPRAYSRALVVEVLVMMLLVSIFAVGVRVVRGATEARATESGLTPHAPIYISGNSGFTAANGVVAGNGTKENPYIIEGWEINASSTNGIEIRNTDAHFIIRKCYIYGGKSNYEGIYFKNVRNGIITNTVLKENFRGAYFLLCSNNTILNCNMSNNHWGVDIKFSSNINISGCNISSLNYVEATVNDGCVYMQDSLNNIMNNNKLWISGVKGRGLYVFGTEKQYFNHTIDLSNKVNGKTVYYYFDLYNTTIENLSTSHLTIAGCTNVTVKNCKVSDGDPIYLAHAQHSTIERCDASNSHWGLCLRFSSFNRVSQCNLSKSLSGIYHRDSSNNSLSNCYFYNNYDGIDLVFSSNNYLNNCWIYNNSYGIQLLESSNNHLTACHIYNNSYRGLYLTASINNTISSCSIYGNTHGIFLFSSSNNNTIYHNSFIKNIGHAYEYFCSINTWDNGYPSGGNYWDDYTGEDLYSGPNQDQPGSDWIGDTPYNISGGNNKDRYPLWYPTDQMPNRPPTANFTYSPASPVTTDTVKFTDTSYDPDGNIVAWLWDFGDGITSTLQNPTHKYADNGIYTVTLIVTDNDNATASVSKNITISNIAPKASFTYSPQNPTILDTIQFADLSTDSDGSIISWLWNFGDGNASTAQNPTHRYPLPGSYTVKLTVTDDDGANDTCTRTITVSAPNQPPTAYIDSISPNPAFYGDTVYFAGHGNDNDGCIAEYCWHSSLDGLLSTASSFNTSVLSVGTHTIYFKVKDNNGTWSEEVIEVLIVSMPNQPPIANAGPDQTVYKNDIVQFDASQSYDPDGTIVNYTWNFGDGSTGTGITATHAYLTKGVYTVTLTVTDNDGATGTDTCIITVLNKPPIADFAYSPTNPTTNGAIKFNDASTDPDGSIMSWLWEFGDGTNSTLQNPSHQYMDDGTYAVTLTVWDNDSESATIKKQIMIRNLLPIATFTYHQGIDVANNDTITLTLRVAGRKWHTVNMSVFEDNTIVGFVSVVREPGSPDERAENISITINSSKQYEILLEYSGLDSGANPVWVTVEYRGITETKHFVFNAPPGEDQNRTLDLDEILDEMIRAQGLVKFDASSSYDPDGFITNYTWNFGDGTAGYGMIVYHNYGDGNYTVTLTVKDNDGATNSKTATITIVIPKHPSPCPHPEIVIIHELKPGNNHINYTVATTTTKLSKGKR